MFNFILKSRSDDETGPDGPTFDDEEEAVPEEQPVVDPYADIPVIKIIYIRKFCIHKKHLDLTFDST